MAEGQEVICFLAGAVVSLCATTILGKNEPVYASAARELAALKGDDKVLGLLRGWITKVTMPQPPPYQRMLDELLSEQGEGFVELTLQKTLGEIYKHNSKFIQKFEKSGDIGDGSDDESDADAGSEADAGSDAGSDDDAGSDAGSDDDAGSDADAGAESDADMPELVDAAPAAAPPECAI